MGLKDISEDISMIPIVSQDNAASALIMFLTSYLQGGLGNLGRNCFYQFKELRLLWGTRWQHFSSSKPSTAKDLLTEGQP